MKTKLQINNTPSLPSSYYYIHGGRAGKTTAFNISERAHIRIKVPRRIGLVSPSLEIFSEALELKAKSVFEFKELSRGFDVYEAQIPTKMLGVGLYFMRVRDGASCEALYSKKCGDSLYFDNNSELSLLMQLTVYSFEYEEPKKILGGVIYHIFVDRFMRSGKSEIPEGAVKVDGEWDKIPEYPEYRGAPLKNNTFYGGTLFGIAEKLDYIASLGAKAIYLSPIFKSVSNHRYDTADYMHVDPMLGGEEGLKHLISEADKRGISIILDGVFNHTGDDSIYFNRKGRFDSLGAYQSKTSKYYPWYDFKEYPDKYTCWWDIEILPRINPDIPECGDYFVGDGGVISHYRDMGVYGFRLDVADELSDSFIEKIKHRLSKGGESVLYGEVWEDASNKIAYSTRKRYYLGRELDGVMNYPLRKGIIEYILKNDTSELAYAIEVMYNAPERVMHTQMNLLGTHDTERILTVLSGSSTEGKTNAELSTLRLTSKERELAITRLKAAYTVLATLPGIPTVFYGDEAGLEGYHDPFNRMPYPWGKESKELVSHYKTLGELRISSPVYEKGELLIHALDVDIFVFSRLDAHSEYLTVFNNSDKERCINFSATAYSLLNKAKGDRHILTPLEAGVYRVRKNSNFEIV